MHAKLTTRPEQDVIAAIQTLNLESVKARAMDPELGEGWTREYADSIEAAYKTYLTMLVKYPDAAEEILLSKDVDEFWHTHILQTRKYSEDCENTFGRFLHHEPHVGEVTSADHERRAAQAATTRALYEREFGNSRNAGAAWTGAGIRAEAAAFSSASILPAGAAFSSASIHSRRAAFSSASIQPERAAFSSASIGADGAAFSSASIRPDGAAFSSAAIRESSAAFSSASIRTESAAFAGESITAGHAAFSSAVASA